MFLSLKKIINSSFLSAILASSVFVFHGEALAVAPPLDPGATVPGHLTSARPSQGYGAMIAAPSKSGPSRAMGGGIGSTLAEFLKNSPNASLIIVPVEFSDVKMGPSGLPAISSMTADMCRFFNSQSGGGISLTSVTAPRVYKLANSMGYYGVSDDAEALVRDAVAAADYEIDFSKFQCVMVAHAGYGDETNPADGGTRDIWSRYWYSGGYNSIATGDGVSINGATIVPELEYEGVSPLGIICHEFGHQLGLPDLYDTSYSTEGGIGRWSLMATGAYNGSPKGSKPALLDPWCRRRLGWIEYEKLSGALKDFSFETGKVYQIAADASNPSRDYFLLEKRGRAAGTYDEGLPGEGLLIYHVNASPERENSLNPNNYTPGLIWLMCANGGGHLTVSPRSKVRGLDTDPYPAPSNDGFYAYSSPSSKTWDGNDSGVSIRNIRKISSGASLTVTADVGTVSAQTAFFRAGSFAVPGVAGRIIVVVRPSEALTAAPEIANASAPGPPVVTAPGAGGKYYYAVLTASGGAGKLTVTLSGTRKSDSATVSEEHALYY